MKDLELLVTLWPSFPHFPKFAYDNRLSGIRLNTAMVKSYELDEEFKKARSLKDSIPLYFDVKGRQLRVTEVMPYKSHLELKLNHPISVNTPSVVLFKGGEDKAMLREVNGDHLIFEGGPSYMVHEGESLHLRHPSLVVGGEQFVPQELEKIELAKKAGFDRYFLSYTERQRDVDEFRELIGKDAELILKIENKQGLEYVVNDFKPDGRTSLMAARGDLYVEVDKPHEILSALKTIIAVDPKASVGSRMLLSLVNSHVPSCADFSELAWLYDIGYKRMMLCDELCLKDDLLSRSVNAFDAFRKSYAKDLPGASAKKSKKSFFSYFSKSS